MKPSENVKAPWGFTKVEPEKQRQTGRIEKPMSRRAATKPLVLPEMESSKVKRRTGFSSSVDMIAYIVTICNGDFTRIRKRKSSMTWFEEWFYYFEYKYGHTNIRQIDMESAWEMHHFALNQIKDCKLALDAAGLESWPPYASLKEDEDLRNKEKWKHYDGQRVVMWDMTNIPAYKFTHSVSQ